MSNLQITSSSFQRDQDGRPYVKVETQNHGSGSIYPAQRLLSAGYVMVAGTHTFPTPQNVKPNPDKGIFGPRLPQGFTDDPTCVELAKRLIKQKSTSS